ncbi:MAG TPA: acyl-CoA dehydrogenase family protein, partial [Chthonomonadales bacterium]|nr:acyl-CoA dehydrogenase family protein [Chthonomonadales bacterium]
MDLALTEEHSLLRDTVRRFSDNEITPYIQEWDRAQTSDPALLRKMADLGLLGICIPARYGGAGMDYLSLGLACEELERGDTSARTVLSVHVGLNSLTLLQWANEDQKQRYLAPQATGEAVAAFGLTEPNAGSDVAAIQTYAVRAGGSYVLNGEKTWISLADVADHFLVFAKTDREAAHRGISAFLVERSFPGVSTSSIHGKLGVRAGNAGSIAFQNARVPVENRVGEEGEGFKIAMSALDKGRFTVAAGAVGTIAACLDASVQYANSRKTFGEPIGKKQLVQQMIARMAQAKEIGRLLYYQVAWRMNCGLRTTREVSLAKWTNCDAALQSANDAIEIHGAYGYTDEFPVERYFRNA